MAENAPNQRALANLSSALDVNRRFPTNVFLGNWERFLFFDADWIFSAEFVEIANALLTIDGGRCVCIADLDAAPDAQQSVFFVAKEITGSAYQSFLNGANVGEGWLHGVGRFGCTSDAGPWCIYCEKGNEIAAIAIRDNRVAEKCAAAIARFKALPIDQAIAGPLSYGFSERALSPEWRSELLRQYAAPQGS